MSEQLARRAPFSQNPAVGPRGQRTQQRIIDAALEVFGEVGFHDCSIERITTRAGCSRVAFYQYFSGKDDVFEQLTAQVARQVIAATDSIDRLTPDAAGHAALGVWVERYAEIHRRSSAVFQVFHSSAESAAGVAASRAAAGEYTVLRIHAKLAAGDLPTRELDAVITVLIDCVGQTLHLARLLEDATPGAYSPTRIHQALVNVMHRTLFGRSTGVNDGSVAPELPRLPAARQAVSATTAGPGVARTATLESLLAAGREVLAARGFHATRVDDIVGAAGLSHGAFYRYFSNVSELTEVLVHEAVRPVGAAIEAAPASGNAVATRNELRRWLRRYNAAHTQEAAMIQAWVDASIHDPALAADSAPALDWARRRLAAFLAPRRFGDVDAEALVMLALLDAFGTHERSTEVIDSLAHVIERGLLGVAG